MTDLEAACKAIRENARENCPGCQTDHQFPEGQSPMTHWCHATIAAAREGMLAAVEECEHLEPVERCATCATQATIERLLEGEGDGQ
jgi:hypothetical protein